MRSCLKSVGVALALVASGAIAPFAPTVNLPEVYAQNQTASPAKGQTSSIQQLLETAKQHYRRAEFKQAIKLYQQIANQSDGKSMV